MSFLFSKKVLFGALALVIVILTSVYFANRAEAPIEPVVEKDVVVTTTGPEYSVIGTSVEGRSIELYKFGNGERDIAFVGGIHGGYEWNSVLLAYQFIDYFTANPGMIPDNLTVNIIPVANPDGLFKVTGKDGRFSVLDVSQSETVLAEGRFNANGVDLNRNFACNWKPESTWRSQVVSAGTSVFSEPEAKAIKNFVESVIPEAVVFWHSQASTVYGSSCNDITLPGTLELMDTYATAAGYNSVPFFDAYEISGAVEDWLSTIGIPAITVELKTHESTDWEQNLAGVKALFGYFGE